MITAYIWRAQTPSALVRAEKVVVDTDGYTVICCRRTVVSYVMAWMPSEEGAKADLRKSKRATLDEMRDIVVADRFRLARGHHQRGLRGP